MSSDSDESDVLPFFLRTKSTAHLSLGKGKAEAQHLELPPGYTYTDGRYYGPNNDEWKACGRGCLFQARAAVTVDLPKPFTWHGDTRIIRSSEDNITYGLHAGLEIREWSDDALGTKGCPRHGNQMDDLTTSRSRRASAPKKTRPRTRVHPDDRLLNELAPGSDMQRRHTRDFYGGDDKTRRLEAQQRLEKLYKKMKLDKRADHVEPDITSHGKPSLVPLVDVEQIIDMLEDAVILNSLISTADKADRPSQALGDRQLYCQTQAQLESLKKRQGTLEQRARAAEQLAAKGDDMVREALKDEQEARIKAETELHQLDVELEEQKTKTVEALRQLKEAEAKLAESFQAARLERRQEATATAAVEGRLEEGREAFGRYMAQLRSANEATIDAKRRLAQATDQAQRDLADELAKRTLAEKTLSTERAVRQQIENDCQSAKKRADDLKKLLTEAQFLSQDIMTKNEDEMEGKAELEAGLAQAKAQISKLEQELRTAKKAAELAESKVESLEQTVIVAEALAIMHGDAKGALDAVQKGKAEAEASLRSLQAEHKIQGNSLQDAKDEIDRLSASLEASRSSVGVARRALDLERADHADAIDLVGTHLSTISRLYTRAIERNQHVASSSQYERDAMIARLCAHFHVDPDQLERAVLRTDSLYAGNYYKAQEHLEKLIEVQTERDQLLEEVSEYRGSYEALEAAERDLDARMASWTRQEKALEKKMANAEDARYWHNQYKSEYEQAARGHVTAQAAYETKEREATAREGKAQEALDTVKARLSYSNLLALEAEKEAAVMRNRNAKLEEELARERTRFVRWTKPDTPPPSPFLVGLPVRELETEVDEPAGHQTLGETALDADGMELDQEKEQMPGGALAGRPGETVGPLQTPLDHRMGDETGSVDRHPGETVGPIGADLDHPMPEETAHGHPGGMEVDEPGAGTDMSDGTGHGLAGADEREADHPEETGARDGANRMEVDEPEAEQNSHPLHACPSDPAAAVQFFRTHVPAKWSNLRSPKVRIATSDEIAEMCKDQNVADCVADLGKSAKHKISDLIHLCRMSQAIHDAIRLVRDNQPGVEGRVEQYIVSASALSAVLKRKGERDRDAFRAQWS